MSDPTLAAELRRHDRDRYQTALFAPGERRGSGHGLQNIVARAEALGGAAEITSAVGKGTRITLRVPVREERR